MKLYLGSAKPPFHPQHLKILGNPDEWVWVDLYVKHPKIKNWDASDLPVKNKSIDEIYASHLLEHLPQGEIVKILKHWKSKLIKMGKLTLNVPDLIWASKELLKFEKGLKLTGYYKDFDGPHGIMNIFYGNQDHTGEFHRAGFTKSVLENYLKQAGFKKIIVKKEFEAHEMGCLLSTCST